MPTNNKIKDLLIKTLATGFGSGYTPVAPGTAGSAVAVLIYLMISDLPLSAYILVTLFVTLVGIPISTKAEILFGQKDSGKIVIDEIAGILITFTMIPPEPLLILFGFLLFRFFDIWKPFRDLEKLKGGFGVMADDVVAGLYASIFLHGVIVFVL